MKMFLNPQMTLSEITGLTIEDEKNIKDAGN